MEQWKKEREGASDAASARKRKEGAEKETGGQRKTSIPGGLEKKIEKSLSLGLL